MSGDASDNPNRHSRVVHIVRGEPSEEELAALVAVLATPADTAAAEPPAPRGAWADPAHRLRTPVHPGPTAWRNSALPQAGRPQT
ncbi:MAG: acyl-CoA carboxylase subunit epsilon [Pseudonocardiales bacterium]|nr:acyl-CoA carboxylase subunit epsilon [Pseudonocardiales bacterium]MBV9032476.1 acyl-CoA carboxylase subunit epsilon [Pseudonocardiales bacterium]